MTFGLATIAGTDSACFRADCCNASQSTNEKQIHQHDDIVLFTAQPRHLVGVFAGDIAWVLAGEARVGVFLRGGAPTERRTGP